MTKITLNAEFNFLQIIPGCFPDADEFTFWGEIFLSQETISILETSEGADRHQIRFCWKNFNFNLNFEHYSDSLWINAEGIEAESQLEQLQKILQSSLS